MALYIFCEIVPTALLFFIPFNISYSPQIFRDGGAGDDRAAVQRGVRVGVPAAGGERGDHGQHAAHRRHGLRHRVRVHRPLQGHARHCQQPLAVM